MNHKNITRKTREENTSDIYACLPQDLSLSGGSETDFASGTDSATEDDEVNFTLDPNIENIRNHLPQFSKKVSKDQLQTLNAFIEKVKLSLFCVSSDMLV